MDQNSLRHVAHLARIGLSDADVKRYSDDLSHILDIIDEMNRCPTDGIEPMSHPAHLSQRLRMDEVTETDQREAFQAQAPATEAGLYLVPKVIEA